MVLSDVRKFYDKAAWKSFAVATLEEGAKLRGIQG